MPAAAVLSFVLAGPAPPMLSVSAPHPNAADVLLARLSSGEKPAVRRREALRAAHGDAMRASASRARPDFSAVVPELIALSDELARGQRMSSFERDTLRGRIKARLEELQQRLQRQVRRERRHRTRNDASRTTRSRTGEPVAAGGPDRNAQQLIDLIQNTIAPESWDVNGGRGSISYYSPLRVLVVRQTGEVHHQLGDGLKQLRR